MKLKHDKRLLNFAFNCSLRRYTEGCVDIPYGRAVQLDPRFSQLTPRLLSGTFRDFQRLKLKCDELLSNVAFNCTLRPYSMSMYPRQSTHPVYPPDTYPDHYGGALQVFAVDSRFSHLTPRLLSVLETAI